MIVPTFVVLLCATVIESLLEGKSCDLNDGGPGVCITLNNCEPVLDVLAAGSSLIKLCGYEAGRFDPIVCCPKNPVTTTTTTTTTTAQVPVTKRRMRNDRRGKIAKKKCAEYAQYVYTLKYPLFGAPIHYSQCAIKTIPLIYGGAKAERMEFPHMAAVGYDLPNGGIGWYCGGTLISETFVLTAAHCTFLKGKGHASWVRVGDLNLVRSDDGARPENRRIVERIKHPDYIPPSKYHDIALLRLESRVPFNAWIRPACLHTKPHTGTKKAVATGWGRVEWLEDGGSDDLLKVTLSIINPQTCNTLWTKNTAPSTELPEGVNENWSICATDPEKDTCQGDSGGPLVTYNKKNYCMYDVVGITSLGKLCGDGFPGIYTRVYNYISWIESTVWGRE